jgi:hypothetical protein
MPKLLPGLKRLVVAFGLFACMTVVAQADNTPVLPGPYSSWTPEQVQQAAQMLKSGSDVFCQTPWMDKAPNSQFYSYGAAICVATYFVNHLPPDYPGLDAIKDSIRKNYTSAKALDSDAAIPATPAP